MQERDHLNNPDVDGYSRSAMGDTDNIYLVQNRDMWQSVVSAVIKAGNFLTS